MGGGEGGARAVNAKLNVVVVVVVVFLFQISKCCSSTDVSLRGGWTILLDGDGELEAHVERARLHLPLDVVAALQ